MIFMDNPIFKALALLELVRLIETGKVSVSHATETTGLSIEELQKLRVMPLTDFIQLTGQKHPELSLSEIKHMGWALRNVEQSNGERELIEYFLKHGAPTHLVMNFFRVPQDVVSYLKQFFKATPVGRTKLPPIAERDLIHRDWLLIRTTSQETTEDSKIQQAHLYRRLHERLMGKYSIAALHQVLTEFDRETE